MTQKLPDDPQQFVAELKALLSRWDAEIEAVYDDYPCLVACLNARWDDDGNPIRDYRHIELGHCVEGK